MLEQTVVFEARTNGYWNYRVPGIVCTRNGVVIASAEARKGTGGDWDGNDVLIRRSLDGGLTWEAPQVVARSEQYGDGPISNFVMVSDAGGAVQGLFCHSYNRVFAIRSTDDGATFPEPVEITAALEQFRETYPWRVIATGPGHGIQLKNDRMVVPVWMSDGSGTEFGAGKLGHRPSDLAVIYSDDHGTTWHCGEFVAHNDGRIVNPNETTAVELSDGRVLLNIRSESEEHRRLVSISADGISGWSEPQFDDALLEPVCFGSILKLQQNSETGVPLIVFVNPDNLENDLIPPGNNLAHDRKRLTVKLSRNDCHTWPISKALEEGPSGYSDLAQAADGTILCLYECGMINHMCDTKNITVARFDLKWLTTGM